MISDFEKYIAINQVSQKSVRLWNAVRKVLDKKRTPLKDIDFSLPHLKSDFIKSELNLIGEEIQNLDEVVKKVTIHSLNEYEVFVGRNIYPDDKKREQSFNNQLDWEAALIQHYGLQLALNKNIEKLNELTKDLNVPEDNPLVLQLVKAIELIREYKNLMDNNNPPSTPKEHENQTFQLETIKEENNYLHLKEIGFKKMIERLNSENENDKLWRDIFVSKNAFELFESFLEEANPDKIMRECSFIYRQMKEKEEPSMIRKHVTNTIFMGWFNDVYKKFEADLYELKTYHDSLTTEKKNRFIRLRKQFF